MLEKIAVSATWEVTIGQLMLSNHELRKGDKDRNFDCTFEVKKRRTKDGMADVAHHFVYYPGGSSRNIDFVAIGKKVYLEMSDYISPDAAVQDAVDRMQSVAEKLVSAKLGRPGVKTRKVQLR